MRRPESLPTFAAWACVFLASVSGQSEMILHKKEGDDAVLKPVTSATGPITSIIWNVGDNIATQWENSDAEVTYYRHFRERGSLNVSSGELTITGLTRNDSAVYTADINDVKTEIRLTVMPPVPVPTVSVSCDDGKTGCTLTCEGNSAGTEHVTYAWRADSERLTTSSREHHVTQENSTNVKEFSCELENPVSWASSKPVPNPFIADTAPPDGSLNINAGLTVFIVLLTAVLLLALVHRLKAGMWFFQKASMPWEADFWRKEQRQSKDAAESNGGMAHQDDAHGDEAAALK